MRGLVCDVAELDRLFGAATIEHLTEGTLTSVGIPTRFSRTPVSIRRPNPDAHPLDEVMGDWLGDLG